MALGLATAVFAYLAGSVQTDIKSALSFASLSQVGIIVAEIGLGFRYVALVHILGHACLRTLQFVRAPTPAAGLPHAGERHRRRACRGAASPWGRLAAGRYRTWLYRLALERGYLDAMLAGLRRRARSSGPSAGATRWSGAGPTSSPAGRRASRTRSSPTSARSKNFHEPPRTCPGSSWRSRVALVGSPVVSLLRDPDRAYRWGLAFTGASFACAFLAWLAFYLGHAGRADSRPGASSRCLFGRQIFALDELNAPLVPAVALLHFLTALATARTHMRRFSFSWSLAAEAIRLATFSCKEPWVLIGLLAVSTVPPYVELRQPRAADAGLRAAHGACSSACWSLGWAAVEAGGHGRRRRPPGGRPSRCWLAILVRCGTVPAHCWVTDWFEHASFGIALLYVTPLSGVYAAVRLVLPIAPGLGPAEHRPALAVHGRLRRRDGDRSSARRGGSSPTSS